MNIRLSREANGTRRNLQNGLRLLVLRRVDLNEFYVSPDQVVILSLVFSCVIFIGSYLLSHPDPEFSVYGIATVATHLIFLAFCGYLFSNIYGGSQQTLQLYIVLLSVWSFFYLGWLAIGNSSFFNYWQLFGEHKYAYIAFNIWIAVVVVSAVSRTFGASKKNLFQILAIYLLILGAPLNLLVFGGFWHRAYVPNTEYKKYQSVNQENTYYRQFQLIEKTRAQLLPQRDGISDIYFVGFGSYANQDVFMKEVRYAKRVFDENFDTKGRSVALINNLSTLEDTLLASKSNLALVLDHIGSLIDRDEDVLFLYLTSHGSKKQRLSVKQRPLTLNSIGPSDLKAILDNSGIKYRVLLVSACYSGGFVEPLQNEYTLVFTASDKDKKSFGCSSMSDFTYFGRAIFKEQMETNYDLIDVFEKAIESIRVRENSEGLEHSNPQLFVGDKIRVKLVALADDIERFNRSSNF